LEQETTMKRTTASTIAVASALALSGPALSAESYPERRVDIIVSFAPGGATDILGRYLADELSKYYDATFVVDNKAGAGGRRGTQLAAQAEPDGYTLFLGQVSSHGVAPPLYGDAVGYDPIEDFAPIALVSASPQVMVVSSNSEIESVADFMEYAKENDVIYGSSGIGTTVHLSGELFNTMAGTDLQHVPYGGSGPAKAGLQSGEVDVMFDDLPSSMSQIKSGDFRALAVTVDERNPELPDVPTLSEAGAEFGLDGFDASAWFVLAAPAGLDAAILGSLNEAMNSVLEEEAVREFLGNNGSVPLGGSPEDAAEHIRTELEKWDGVIEAADITVN
jgi:tripartite-type tricarboxylate transporter receptor subunit TctC